MLVRYDGQVTVRPDRAQLVAAVGGTVRDDIGDCDVAIFGADPAGLERHGDRLAVCLDDGHRVPAGRETGRTCSTIAESPAM